MTAPWSELDALYAVTTKGAWTHEPGSIDVVAPNGVHVVALDDMDYDSQSEDDSAFIAAIHNAYPSMRSEVEALRAQVENWQRAVVIYEDIFVEIGIASRQRDAAGKLPHIPTLETALADAEQRIRDFQSRHGQDEIDRAKAGWPMPSSAPPTGSGT